MTDRNPVQEAVERGCVGTPMTQPFDRRIIRWWAAALAAGAVAQFANWMGWW